MSQRGDCSKPLREGAAGQTEGAHAVAGPIAPVVGVAAQDFLARQDISDFSSNFIGVLK